jgi:hypothetical protein
LNDPLLARATIADLVHTYALHIRTGNGSRCADLFTDDAFFEIREAPAATGDTPRVRARLEGKNAIVSYLGRTTTTEARVCPFIYNLLVDVNGREATSNCLMTTLVWSSGHQLVGEYHDSFRFDDRWRFSSRVFTILGEFAFAPVTPRA